MPWFYRYFATPTTISSLISLICALIGNHWYNTPPKWLALLIIGTVVYALIGGLIATSNPRRFFATAPKIQSDVLYVMSVAWNLLMLFHAHLLERSFH